MDGVVIVLVLVALVWFVLNRETSKPKAFKSGGGQSHDWERRAAKLGMDDKRHTEVMRFVLEAMQREEEDLIGSALRAGFRPEEVKLVLDQLRSLHGSQETMLRPKWFDR